MKEHHKISLIFTLAGSLAVLMSGCTTEMTSKAANNTTPPSLNSPAATKEPMEKKASDDVFDGKKVEKSEAEWRAQLTPEQFHILREEGTDPSNRSQYNDNHESGDYYCAACHLKLFSSKTKFESGTGWPSFYQPINAKNVVEKTDSTLGVSRTEIECARCGGHLGHVFDDGPKPTGLRYCMNGTALKFEK